MSFDLIFLRKGNEIKNKYPATIIITCATASNFLEVVYISENVSEGGKYG